MGLHAITTRGMRARTACVCPNCDRGLDVAERSPWVDRVWLVLCDECETGPACGNCGKPGAPVATFGGDVFCHDCMHALLVDELEHAANCVRGHDRVRLLTLVARTRTRSANARELFDFIGTDAARWDNEHARAHCRLACAWREAIRLGPVSALGQEAAQ